MSVMHKVGDTLIIVPANQGPARVGRVTSATENADGSTTYTLVDPHFEDGLGYMALPDE